MTTLGILGRLRQSLWTHPLATRRTDWRIVADVQARALRMRTLTDAGLHGAADQLRTQVQGGASLRQPEIVSQAFACLYESLRREQGIELYEVQILAGLALSGGAIAEMQTGEGKTLAAALPAFLFSLTGAGVHVATPNHYLASRDCELLAPVFLRLGTRAALLPEEHAPDAKRAAYAADVTYGTGYEFGFDYLRDQLLRLADRNQPLGHRFRQVLQGDLSTATQFVQRGLALAIIDEVDSVLIDEACMPLVIAAAGAGRADDPAPYQTAAHVARQLIAGQDFTLDAVERRIALTNAGSARIHLALPRSVGSLRRAWSEYVRQALHAQHLLQRDVDYVVADDRAVIVDEFTGRVYAERSWRDGLHQAVAAKEGLPIDEETAVAARISRQRYFRQYAQICGMTGTARGAEREFWRLFQLPIVEIPLHRPSQRRLLPTRAFATTDAKLAAIVAEVLKLHRQGRPVLVGTRTIDSSEQIARRLSKTGVVFRLLNGKQDADEAAVIAQAGERGAITIATNMAGRGTDIRLGNGVAALGGLHVIGVEHHDSRRIDRQLAGRTGRQGDPGTAQFYIAADDALVRRHAPALATRMAAAPPRRGDLISDLASEITAAQRRGEFEGRVRRHALLAYDDWSQDMLKQLAGDD